MIAIASNGLSTWDIIVQQPNLDSTARQHGSTAQLRTANAQLFCHAASLPLRVHLSMTRCNEMACSSVVRYRLGMYGRHLKEVAKKEGRKGKEEKEGKEGKEGKEELNMYAFTFAFN